jgi:hypothetical protein
VCNTQALETSKNQAERGCGTCTKSKVVAVSERHLVGLASAVDFAIMGAALSSILDDCHLRDVPAFFHNLGSSMSGTRHGGGGEETYMVYAPSAARPMSRNADHKPNSRASYSGPSQGHVRSDLVADYYDQSSTKLREVDPVSCRCPCSSWPECLRVLTVHWGGRWCRTCLALASSLLLPGGS